MTDTDPRDEGMRAVTRALFGRAEPDTDTDTEASTPPNYSPREGNNPTAEPADMRHFTRALFNRALSE